MECGGGPSEPDVVQLSLADSHHAVHVLRLREGDLCEVVLDGHNAAVWEAVVERPVVPTRVLLKRVSEREGREACVVTLLQALPQVTKIDDIVNQGTQVGVNEFVLVEAKGSPRGAFDKAMSRCERWQRIAREAAKQSRQVSLPLVRVSRDGVEEARSLVRRGCHVAVLDPSPDAVDIREWTSRVSKISDCLHLAVCVGPEGGWMAEETDDYRQAGLAIVRLGRRILRTETAGPVATAVIRCMLGCM